MAWTTPRTWTDGELVTKAIMDPHVRDNFNAVSWRLLARKTGDTSRNTTTTPTDDPHLTWAIASSEQWMFKCGLTMTAANATPDFKCDFTFPAGATFIASTIANDAGGTLTRLRWQTSGTTQTIAIGATTPEFYEITGVILNGGTAGNVVLQWSQNTSDGGNTTLQQNSYFVGSKLA